MTLFTAEGLLRAWVRGSIRGMVSTESVVHHAYNRWLLTQSLRPQAGLLAEPDGWLFGVPELHHSRAPGNTCLAALQSATSLAQPADNDSKGCGGVMRVAPVGLFLWREPEQAFDLAARLARLTHGHPTGYLAAGAFALVIARLCQGSALPAAVDHASRHLVGQRHADETLRAMRAALDPGRLRACGVPSELGEGWLAEEALAIALFCVASTDSFEDVVVLAANHSGDSDSTAAMAGNLAGAMYGVDAIPRRWTTQVELRHEIEQVAADLSEVAEGRAEAEVLDRRYPGW